MQQNLESVKAIFGNILATDPTPAEIIDALVAESGLTLADLAIKAGYEERTLKRARTGEIALSDRMLRNLRRAVESSRLPKMETLPTPPGVSIVGGSQDGSVTFYQIDPGLSPRAKLRAAMMARGISVAQLAKETGFPLGFVENMVNATGRINESLAKAISKVMPELQPEDLLDGSETPRIMDESFVTATHGTSPPMQLPGKARTRYVPLVSWAAAGRLAEIDASDEAYAHEAVMTNVPGEAFGVEIKGDSMSPEINPGDFAIVRRDAAPSIGGVVLVKTLNGDVLCKRYQTRDGGKLVILSSVNRSYEPIEIPINEIAFIYPVKQVTRNY